MNSARLAFLTDKFLDPSVHAVRIPVIEPLNYRTMWADHVRVYLSDEYPRDNRSILQGLPRYKAIEITREQFFGYIRAWELENNSPWKRLGSGK